MNLRDATETTVLASLGLFAAGMIGWVTVDSWRNNRRARAKASARQVTR